MVKNLPALWETWARSPDWEDPLEEDMSTHSSFLAWRILWTEDLGNYRSKNNSFGFPGDSDSKESSCSAGDSGSIPGSGRSPGEGNGNPLQYSCLENSMDRGAWQATVHGVAELEATEQLYFLSVIQWYTMYVECSGLIWLHDGSSIIAQNFIMKRSLLTIHLLTLAFLFR